MQVQRFSMIEENSSTYDKISGYHTHRPQIRQTLLGLFEGSVGKVYTHYAHARVHNLPIGQGIDSGGGGVGDRGGSRH